MPAAIEIGGRILHSPAASASHSNIESNKGTPYSGWDFHPHWCQSESEVDSHILIQREWMHLPKLLAACSPALVPSVFCNGGGEGWWWMVVFCILTACVLWEVAAASFGGIWGAFLDHSACHVAVLIDGYGYSLQTMPSAEGTKIISIEENNPENFFYTREESSEFTHGIRAHESSSIMNSYTWKKVQSLPRELKVVRSREQIRQRAKQWHGLPYDLRSRNCALFAADLAHYALGLPDITGKSS